MARDRQFQAFVISDTELAKLIGLPPDHCIVRIWATDNHAIPGIVISVEGPGGVLTPKGGAVHHHHQYEHWRDREVETMRKESLKQFGPYQW